MVVGGGDQKSEAARIGSINIDKPDSPKHNTQAEIAKAQRKETAQLLQVMRELLSF